MFISQSFKEIEDVTTHFKLASDIIKDQFFFEDGIILNSDSKPAISVEERFSLGKLIQFQLSKVIDQLVFAMEMKINK